MTTLHTERSLRDDLARKWSEVDDADSHAGGLMLDAGRLVRGRKTGARMSNAITDAIRATEAYLDRLKEANAIAARIHVLAEAEKAKEACADLMPKGTEGVAGYARDLTANMQSRVAAQDAGAANVVPLVREPRFRPVVGPNDPRPAA